jgi:rare lipoprotein A
LIELKNERIFAVNHNKNEVILKSLIKVFEILIMISLVGFTYIENEKIIAEPEDNSPKTIIVDRESLTKTTLVEYIDKGTMKASWYGPRFHGRITANGEVFDQMGFTAAHKKLKFGTVLRITNPQNDKSVVVRINDRGPFKFGRQLDLSKAAAMELEILEKGVARLKVEEITLKGINLPVITLN